jgi:hypothetical protein
MRAKPRSQQRPKAFHRVDVDFVKAIAVIIPCVFTPTVTEALMRVAPWLQTTVTVVCLRVHTRPGRPGGLDQRLDRHVLDVFSHPDHHVATPLDHAEERRCLGFEGAPSAGAPEPAAPTATPLCATSSGWPVWPATMDTAAHATAVLNVGDGVLATMPWRHWQVICWTSDGCRSSALAMGACARCSPLKDRHTLQTRRG